MKKHILFTLCCTFIGNNMYCYPTHNTQWRSYIPSYMPSLPSSQNIVKGLWNKYGIISGTLAALAIATGVWFAWKYKTTQPTSIPKQKITPITDQYIENLIKSGTTLQKIDTLDILYTPQNWPHIFDFHSFIISLLGNKIDKQTLINLIEAKFKHTAEKANDADAMFFYPFLKELAIIDQLIQPKVNLLRVTMQAPQSTITLLRTLIPTYILDRNEDQLFETKIIEKGTIEECVYILDILYAIQRWGTAKNFHTVILSTYNKQSSSQLKTKEELLNLFARKDPSAYRLLQQELTIMSGAGINFIITGTHILEQDDHKKIVQKILKRLIALTKPTS